ncbi:Rossmann-like alpha-beta-alpha sandwich fold [Babesia duncani]|uniref:Rossmann-like alpha-beta-alpha sandwich fold n=1 Tax=Babesia duncani TaxID=323732 RepID=A0AAD9UPM8_9APIC|nr:Rossmann-like alpha-beta-alpha sandwich fold [Babesia duncani]
MKVVFSDPYLIDLLQNVSTSGITETLCNTNFRKFDRILKPMCNSCLFCKVVDSVDSIASTIVKIIVRGTGNLVVYIVVESQNQLHSIFLIDYIRSLYTLVIHHYLQLGKDLELLSNPQGSDLSIIPIYDWKFLSSRNISIATLSCNNIDHETFLHLPAFSMTFHAFYNYINGSAAVESNRIKSKCTKLDCLGMAGDSGQIPQTLEIRKYHNVMCCGEFLLSVVVNIGTFDRLHYGHKLLLLVGYLSTSCNLYLGLNGSREMLTAKEDWDLIQPYEQREAILKKYIDLLEWSYPPLERSVESMLEPEVHSYHCCDFINGSTRTSNSFSTLDEEMTRVCLNGKSCGQIGISADDEIGIRIERFKLLDNLGPARWIPEQHAMIISPDTMDGANKVNEYRKLHKLPQWHIVSVGSVIYPQDLSWGKDRVKLSSSLLRKRSGNCNL